MRILISIGALVIVAATAVTEWRLSEDVPATVLATAYVGTGLALILWALWAA